MIVETRSEDEMITGVRERLLEAIRVRLRADVPVGIFLSGGIDSSAIAGMVKHLVQQEGARVGNGTSSDASRIECFTVQFDRDSGADESGLYQFLAYHPLTGRCGTTDRRMVGSGLSASAC